MKMDPFQRLCNISLVFTAFMFGGMFGYVFGQGGPTKEEWNILLRVLDPWNLISGIVVVGFTGLVLSRKSFLRWIDKMGFH